MKSYAQKIIYACLLFGTFSNPTELCAQTGFLYYLPGSEQDINAFFDRLDNQIGGDEVVNYISISVPIANTVIYYDHWEDGYEADITNPVQPTTECWGDGIEANGAGQGYSEDIAQSGELITLLTLSDQTIAIPSPVIANGRDKLYASQPIVIVRSAWDFEFKTLIAGALSPSDTSFWGTCYKIPVANNSTNWDLLAVSVMALEDNTLVQMDWNKDSIYEESATINEGETFYSHISTGAVAGGEIISSAPVQVSFMTGDINEGFDSRWFQMLPCDKYSNLYYSPVPDHVVGTAPTVIYFYNNDTVDRTITVTLTGGATSSLPISAESGASYTMPLATAACFEAPIGSSIYALGVYGSGFSGYDWGFEMIPGDLLLSSVYMGMGQGQDPLVYNLDGFNGSPIFTTVTETSYLFVDWDNNGIFEKVDLNGDGDTDDIVDGIDENTTDQGFLVNKLQSLRLFDIDADQSGALIISRNSQDITGAEGGNVVVAWGQDRDAPDYVPGSPNQDWGYTTTGIDIGNKNLVSDVSLTKTVSNSTPQYGDTLVFTIVLANDFTTLASDIIVEDVLPAGFTYAGSAAVTSGTLDDSNAPTLLWSVPTLAGNALDTLSFEAVIIQGYHDTIFYKNTTEVIAMFGNDVDSTPNNDDGDQSEDDESGVIVVTPPPIAIGMSKMLKQLVNNTDGSYDATFLFYVENLEAAPIYDLTLSDDLETEFGAFQAVLADVDAVGEYGIVAAPSLVHSTLSQITGINASYDGTAANINILNPVSNDSIGVAGNFTIEMTLRFYPAASKTSFTNQGIVSGDNTEDGITGGETTDLSDASGCPCGLGGSSLSSDNAPAIPTGVSGQDFQMITDTNCNGNANEAGENDPVVFQLSDCTVRAGTLGY